MHQIFLLHITSSQGMTINTEQNYLKIQWSFIYFCKTSLKQLNRTIIHALLKKNNISSLGNKNTALFSFLIRSYPLHVDWPKNHQTVICINYETLVVQASTPWFLDRSNKREISLNGGNTYSSQMLYPEKIHSQQQTMG